MTAGSSRTRERTLVLAAVMLACVAGPALGWRSLSAARADLSVASGTHARTIADARRLESLSRRRAVLSDQPRPEPDLVARIGAQMTAAGLDPALVARVNVTAAQPVGDGTLRRQSAALTIALPTPGDLARWVLAWAEAEPAWTVVSLRLDHSGRASPTPYTASIALESLHRAEPAKGSTTSEVNQ